MTLGSIFFSLSFVGTSLLLSIWMRLGISKEIIIASIRASIQLLIVGYVLIEIFTLKNWPYITAMLLVMIIIAAANASRKLPSIRGTFWRVFVSIAVAELFSMGLLLVLRIVPSTPQYVIPLSGMIIGNAMVGASLLLDRIKGELAGRQGEVMVYLSLGSAPRQAVDSIVKSSIRASMIPTIDSMKTVGLVQLPGMMTGQILAGADPGTAVRYQLLILFTLIASIGICSVFLALLSYPLFFTKASQIDVRTFTE